MNLFTFGVAAALLLPAAPPIALHPENPHYFLFRAKPTVLVTSGEHYGAVLNLDFDYGKYLSTLAKDRLNLTRIFTGAYWELQGSFRIADNTLAPKPERFISPWPKRDGRFDLSQWNDAFFKRLKDFVAEAGRRGVVVEVVLFCPYYDDKLWDQSPLNAKNNVSGIGETKRTDVLALKDAKLTEVQAALVRKIVSELRQFDNIYYEICNEPYYGGVTAEWQRHIAAMIGEAESGMKEKHLIAQNIANGSVRIADPNPAVSLFNFHYSRPPASVGMNYGLGKAIGMNETGFDGNADAAYRIQGWDFVMAGGAEYNNLDYSFTVGHEDGTYRYPEAQPGGGSVQLRRQLGILRDFLDRINFVRMSPGEVTASGGASARMLREEGKTYAVYVHHGKEVKDAKPKYQVAAGPQRTTVTVSLPAGDYEASWTDTRTGAARTDRFQHGGGERVIESPAYEEDIALSIRTTAGILRR